MTLYVDDLQDYPIEKVAPAARRFGTRWCHLSADSVPELLKAARRLGLSASYIQRGGKSQMAHFDLTPSKRAQAVRLGAVEVTTAEMLARWNETQK